MRLRWFVYMKYMQCIWSHDCELFLMSCICYTSVSHKQWEILFLKLHTAYVTCMSEFYITLNLIVLTRVHNLRHMLSTCCYVKTSDNLTYVVHISTENEPRRHRVLRIWCTCMTHAEQNMFMWYLLLMWLYLQNVSVVYVSHVLIYVSFLLWNAYYMTW